MCHRNKHQTGKVTTHRIREGSAETNLLLLLDAMGKRYGKLPSELFLKADTFDLMVMDVAIGYEQIILDKQNNKVNPRSYDEDELMERLNKVRANEN